MDESQDKSKEFLNAIAKIKKLVHRNNKKSDNFHPAALMTLKTIHLNAKNSKQDENYCGIKTSDLTQKLCITKPATSKMLNLLEEKELIERSSNKNDRRVVYVKLTEKGEEFLKLQDEKLENFVYKMVEKMGEEDTDNLIRLLGKLYDVIEELQGEF